MSYSFNVRAASKGEALEKVTEEMDRIVQGQEAHADGQEHVMSVVSNLVGMLADVPDAPVVVACSGSISRNDVGVLGVSVNVAVKLTGREVVKPEPAVTSGEMTRREKQQAETQKADEALGDHSDQARIRAERKNAEREDQSPDAVRARRDRSAEVANTGNEK